MRRSKIVIITVVSLVMLAVLGVFTYFWFSQTGPFYHPGEIHYDATVSAEQRDFVTEALADLNEDLAKDVTISAHSSQKAEGEDVLYNIYVPVTDFYDALSDVDLDEGSDLSNLDGLNDNLNASSSVDPNSASESYCIHLIPVLDLTPEQKLLSLNQTYYLDTLDSGAIFSYLAVSGEEKDVVKITTLLEQRLPEFPSKNNVLTLAQTGVTALSRRMNTKLTRVGNAAYFAEKIAPFLSQFDLTHTSNESSFSNFATSDNICSKPGMIDALTAIGLDIVELTGNHNQDCGDEDALSTLSKYRELGLKIVGGGETAAAAAVPLNLTDKGSNITLLGYNLSTGGYTLDETPGANFYTEEKATADIQAAKARGDTVIVDIQYYECNNYDTTYENTACDRADSAAGDQIGLFRHLIDLGADVVVGTAAHQPQTYEKYHDGEIYYGLGNLFFDQTWWPGTTRSLILVHYFYDNQLIQTRIVPTVYDDTMQTRLMDPADVEKFIERLNAARPADA